ncbi:uncharacterized protein LOC108100715 isoform X2 [Drosophila ficusphila]|uniref:uncharacterized protein LOC108100715 isoform X2 n=1 Tax=Drosophila ficusphila TaxID=30025 RepID=UPI0007E7E20C|nr:uncharacterized protein LOC108100715 isoform X2 [Drosophila ficusphila]
MAVSFRRSAIARVCLSMHTYSVTYEGSPNNTPGSSSYVPCLTFAPGQNESNQTVEQRIGPLVAERTSRRRFFYGIEVTANEMGGGPPVCLNFNHFLPLLPTFVSVVWLNQRYWDVEPIGQVRSLQMAKHLATHIPVLPHLTAFRLSERRLNQFLDLNFSSILAVRGDQVHEDQRFRLALPMIEHLRQQRENISICVGGYPEGYTNLGDFPPAFTKNIAFLKKKPEQIALLPRYVTIPRQLCNS